MRRCGESWRSGPFGRIGWLFVRNTLKRLYFFWFGVPSPSGNTATRFFRSLNFGFLSTAGLLGLLLALRRRVYGGWLFAFAFLTLPAVYYFVTVHARFRHPLEPLDRASRGFSLPERRIAPCAAAKD